MKNLGTTIPSAAFWLRVCDCAFTTAMQLQICNTQNSEKLVQRATGELTAMPVLSSAALPNNKKKNKGKAGREKAVPQQQASGAAGINEAARSSNRYEHDKDPGQGLHAVLAIQGQDDSGTNVHANVFLKCVGRDGLVGQYNSIGTMYNVDKDCYRDENTQGEVAMWAILYMKATDIEDCSGKILSAKAVQQGWTKDKRGGITWYKKDTVVIPDTLCAIENLSRLMELPDFIDTLVQIERVATFEELERTSKTALCAAIMSHVPEREMLLQDVTRSEAQSGYGKHCIVEIHDSLVTAYMCLRCVVDEGQSGVYRCVQGLCLFAEKPERSDRAFLSKYISQDVADLAVQYAKADDCEWKHVTRQSMVHKFRKATTLKHAEVQLKRIKSIREFECAVRTLEVNCRQNADRNEWM